MGSLLIDVFDTSFVIKSNENDEYLEKLLGYYKKIISQIQMDGSLSDPVQISALAGVMLCDELYREKSKNARSGHDELIIDVARSDEAERITNLMIDKINKALQ